MFTIIYKCDETAPLSVMHPRKKGLEGRNKNQDNYILA